MLDLLISGKTRLKLLTRFFLAPEMRGHLRGLAEEFGESTNAIRLELNRFEQGGLLLSEMEQNRKVFRANQEHPLYPDITSLLRKHIGVDRLIEQVLDRVGNVSQAYITGDLALGRDGPYIDLLIIGDDIHQENLQHLVRKAENLIHRKIIFTILSPDQLTIRLHNRSDIWKIWGK